MSTMNDKVTAALDATENEDPQVKAAAVTGALIPEATLPKDVGFLWKALVVGLIAVLVIAVGGILYAVLDGSDTTTPDVIVTVFTTTFAGLVGLFVKAPTER